MIKNRELGIECIRFSELLGHLYKYILHFQFEQRHACLSLQCRKTIFKNINPIPVSAIQRYKYQILSASLKILTNAYKCKKWNVPNKTLNRSVCYSSLARVDSVTVSLFVFFIFDLYQGVAALVSQSGANVRRAGLSRLGFLIVFFLTFPVF